MTKPAAEQFADALMDRIERETRHAPRGLLKSWIVEEYMRLHPHAVQPTNAGEPWRQLVETMGRSAHTTAWFRLFQDDDGDLCVVDIDERETKIAS